MLKLQCVEIKFNCYPGAYFRLSKLNQGLLGGVLVTRSKSVFQLLIAGGYLGVVPELSVQSSLANQTHSPPGESSPGFWKTNALGK